ncbi:NBR1-Ig-like domain-containing protein [Actinoplanes sp. NPDC051475]|uniref:NBR1-Ig-like domain-containing protein n=1 Tax=Actinoplanes sp. NPDC051475 TaxID=3157225 RepID=UPI00344D90C1
MDHEVGAVDGSRSRTVAQQFAEQLRALRDSVGDPSFRAMAARSGRISHTTLYEAAAGLRFPSWETTREFVRACDGDEAAWRIKWKDAQRGDTPAPETPDVTATSGPTVTVGRSRSTDTESGTTIVGGEPSRTRLRAFAGAAAVVLLTAAAILSVGAIVLHRRGQAATASPAVSASAPATGADRSEPRIPGDASMFVADVTIPDGTVVKTDSTFVKVWALANTGSVAWHGRWLVPEHPSGPDDSCQVPERAAIGDTLPGEQVMISVRVTTTNRPGQCWVSWKMVDERGQLYFPSHRPVVFLVNVA